MEMIIYKNAFENVFLQIMAMLHSSVCQLNTDSGILLLDFIYYFWVYKLCISLTYGILIEFNVVMFTYRIMKSLEWCYTSKNIATVVTTLPLTFLWWHANNNGYKLNINIHVVQCYQNTISFTLSTLVKIHVYITLQCVTTISLTSVHFLWQIICWNMHSQLTPQFLPIKVQSILSKQRRLWPRQMQLYIWHCDDDFLVNRKFVLNWG